MAHAAALEEMSEAALDHLSALAHGVRPDAGFQPCAVAVNGMARRLVAMPAQITIGGLRLGDPRLPDAAVEQRGIESDREMSVSPDAISKDGAAARDSYALLPAPNYQPDIIRP
ncbi:MAG: hypothetical protein ACLQDM_13195 [Bradyrhizobium sp.]